MYFNYRPEEVPLSMAKMEERPGHPSVTVRVPGRFSVPPSPTDSDGKCAEALCSWGRFTPPLPVDARANVTGGRIHGTRKPVVGGLWRTTWRRALSWLRSAPLGA